MKLFTTAILAAFLQATAEAGRPEKARCRLYDLDDPEGGRLDDKLIFREKAKWAQTKGADGKVIAELDGLAAGDYSVQAYDGTGCTGNEVESALNDLTYVGGDKKC